MIADLDETPPQLGDGYRVVTRVVLWEGASVVKIPTSALFQGGAQWYVFVAQDGRARRRAIQVGHRNAFEAEIAGGLEPDELVIRHPSDKLADGVRVLPHASGNARSSLAPQPRRSPNAGFTQFSVRPR